MPHLPSFHRNYSCSAAVDDNNECSVCRHISDLYVYCLVKPHDHFLNAIGGAYFDMSPDITPKTLERATLRFFVIPGPANETVHLRIRSIHRAPPEFAHRHPNGSLHAFDDMPVYDNPIVNVSEMELPLNSSGYWKEVRSKWLNRESINGHKETNSTYST